MVIFRPLWVTGANGEPDATRARPSVQRIRSSAVASDFEVGFESGKMIGRSTFRAISLTIGSEKAPPTVERPIRIVAFILPITSARPMCPLELRGHPATLISGRA